MITLRWTKTSRSSPLFTTSDSTRHGSECKNLAKENGTTIFICTHNLPPAESICDGIGLINQGRLSVAGEKDELIASLTDRKPVQITTDVQTHSLAFEEVGQINGHIRSVLATGEHIVDVTVIRPTLEDLYFHYMERNLR